MTESGHVVPGSTVNVGGITVKAETNATADHIARSLGHQLMALV